MKMGKELWSYMYRKQDLMEALGLGDDLAITKDVALCILANPGITLEHIIRSSVFAGLGRSTVKRAVKSLMDRGYVTSSQSEEDKRCFNLTWRYKEC
jgi:DNA-binding MarR family transcriptional regulator